MLIAATIDLQAETAVELPAHAGERVRGAFLATLARHDPAMAEAIHATHAVQPYTTAWLGPRGALPAGTAGTMRWTAITAPLARLLCDTVLPSLGPTFALSGATWRVIDWRVDTPTTPLAGDEPSRSGWWAGSSTYEALAGAWLLDRRRPPPRLELVFASPTTFHSGGRWLPLPLPRLVFGSLLERWNALAPLRLGDDVVAYAEQALAIGRFRLQTEAVPLSGGIHIGFTGRCTYTLPVGEGIPPYNEYAWRALHLLATFAFYAGVGAKTTMGLGTARPAPAAGALRPHPRPSPADGR